MTEEKHESDNNISVLIALQLRDRFEALKDRLTADGDNTEVLSELITILIVNPFIVFDLSPDIVMSLFNMNPEFVETLTIRLKYAYTKMVEDYMKDRYDQAIELDPEAIELDVEKLFGTGKQYAKFLSIVKTCKLKRSRIIYHKRHHDNEVYDAEYKRIIHMDYESKESNP